jgi:FAD/FMN-containing dehydrogenase
VEEIAAAYGVAIATFGHGVGLLERPALGRELDDVAVDLHTKLKAAFDPAGILNPGKSVPLR